MPDFGQFKGFSEKLFGDKNFAGQIPSDIGNDKESFKNYLLDDNPGSVGAWSVRLLSFDYTGPCMRVRRDSDNAEIEVGFVGGLLDVGAINDFANAPGGASVYVQTWFDQSGNGVDLSQATYNLQPMIGDANGVLLDNDIPYFRCTANTHGLENNAGVDILGNLGHSTFVVMRQKTQQNISNSNYAYFSYGGPGQGTCVRMVMEQPDSSGYGVGYRINAGNQLNDSSAILNNLFYSYNLNYTANMTGTSPTDSPFYVNGEAPTLNSNAFSTTINMQKQYVRLNAGISNDSTFHIYPATTEWGEVVMYPTDLNLSNTNFDIINAQRDFWDLEMLYIHNMLGYVYNTEEEAIEARDIAAKYKGLPVSEDSKTLYWVDYSYSSLDNFWYIKYIDTLEEALGAPIVFEVSKEENT